MSKQQSDIDKITSFLAEITLMIDDDTKYCNWLNDVRELAHLRWLIDDDYSDAELVEFPEGESVLVI